MRGERQQLAEDLAAIDGGSGREINGLPSAVEKFERLEANRDYHIVERNARIKAVNTGLEDYFLFVNPEAGSKELIVEPPHWRTITSPDVHTWVDVYGQPAMDAGLSETHFYTVNTKGSGYGKTAAYGKSLSRFSTWIKEDEAGEHAFDVKVLGLTSRGDYLDTNMVERSQFLTDEGLRNEVFWGVAQLKNVFFQGERLSIAELRRRGVIPKRRDYQPYMGVRVMKTNDRIAQLLENEPRRRDLFAQAFRVFNRETRDEKLNFPQLQLGNADHEKIFTEEFFRRMGRNLAVTLNLGRAHFQLHSSNVTSAAELADIGTMSHWQADTDEQFGTMYHGVRRAHLKDMRDIAYDCKFLRRAAQLADLARPDRAVCRDVFLDGFHRGFDEEAARQEKTDPAQARQWVEEIADAVIVKGEYLAPLRSYDVTDWPIRRK